MNEKKTLVIVPMGSSFNVYRVVGEIEFGNETATEYAESWDLKFKDDSGSTITVKGPFVIKESQQ
jgi:hypothetical protein